MKYRYANIGLMTIDLKLNIMFQTNDPENIKFHGTVKRGFSHFRSRPKAFNVLKGKGIQDTVRSGLGCSPYDSNWLGQKWRSLNNKSNRDYPTFNRILNGIILEAKDQIKLITGMQD
jgi:hypothetical protein